MKQCIFTFAICAIVGVGTYLLNERAERVERENTIEQMRYNDSMQAMFERYHVFNHSLLNK